MYTLNMVSNKLVLSGRKFTRRQYEYARLGCLFVFACWLLKLSWRKWLDPQIDYGRELYIPWQLSIGGKLFKDVDDLYGPLSRFIDAGLFKVFGPGMMVLAFANICVYCGIFFLIYILFNKAWGHLPAIMASFVFIGVFSFSSLTVTANYNFVTPYSQQVTHGYLVCLVLIYILPAWIEKQSLTLSLSAGFLFGLTTVLKPEFILASGLIIAVALLIRTQKIALPSLRVLANLVVGACLPTAIFYIYFRSYLGPLDAYLAASHAWLNGIFIWKDQLTTHLLNSFSGFDSPKINLLLHGFATLTSIAIIGFIFAIAYLANRLSMLFLRISILIIGFAGLFYISVRGVNWSNMGQCFIGLLLLYTGCSVVQYYKKINNNNKTITEGYCLRLFLTVFALALMTRMLLNGRVYQYGFFQASVAAMVITAVLFGEISCLPWLGPFGQKISKVYCGFLIFVGVTSTIIHSKAILDAKTLSIGSGPDQFYVFQGNIFAAGQVIGTFSDMLLKQPPNKSIIVIPEGIMINYLARKKSPVADINYYTNPEIESAIIRKLKKEPPSWIVYVNRDLTEYGVTEFGAKGQSGEELMKWINTFYHVVISTGSNPPNTTQVFGRIFELNGTNVSEIKVDPKKN